MSDTAIAPAGGPTSPNAQTQPTGDEGSVKSVSSKAGAESAGVPNRLNELDLNDITVEIKNLKFTYESNKAGYLLNDISLTFPRGAIYGFLGPSGCGKTTIIKLIVGRLKPTEGTIRVNGKKVNDPSNKIPGVGIGYMPQDYALYGEFTILETMHYYSSIYGLPANFKKKRIDFLIKFLELPDPNRLVKVLSGGQKRRTSLAIAIIHNPPLLILDEPTVGVDPMLRERVWKHLVKLSTEEKTSILITTHYIEECRRAHVIALMRSGKLLVENSPATLLRHFKTTSLEDVFLQVCKFEEQPNSPADMPMTVGDERKARQKGAAQPTTPAANKPPPTVSSNSTVWTRFMAITHKNVMRLWRQKLMLLAVIILPALTLSLFCLCIGKNPHHLNIAVYNADTTAANLGDQFLDKIDTKTLVLERHSSSDSAKETVSNGHTYGALIIPGNFTASLKTRIGAQGFVVDDQTLNDSTIEFYGDLTDLVIYQTMFGTLHEAEVAFQLMIIANTGGNSSVKPNPKAMLPLVEFKAVYGSTHPLFRDFGTPSFIIIVSYVLSMALTALNMVTERKEGLLDRTLVAGVTIPEILVAEIVIQYGVLLFQLIVLLLVVLLVFDVKNEGNLLLILLLATLQGATGMAYGLFVSAISSTEEAALMLCVASFVPYLVISGVLWPLEGMHFMLQTISRFTPQTLPIISLRNIMLKGWGLTYTMVWSGFMVTIGWLIIFIILATIFSTFNG